MVSDSNSCSSITDTIVKSNKHTSPSNTPKQDKLQRALRRQPGQPTQEILAWGDESK